MTGNYPVTVRDVVAGDIPVLAKLWFDGWQDAHAELLPAGLKRLRTLESFQDRLADALSDVRVAVIGDRPVALSTVKGEELYQFYVAHDARGTGIASSLMSDAINRLRAFGMPVAWLACAVGNERAARFYRKSGWRYAGTMTGYLPTLEGTFTLEVWRYELDL